MKTPKENAALYIIKRLTGGGFIAMYAGGYVRDMALGVGVADRGDIDIATSATPQQVCGLFSSVVGVGEHFGVMIVVVDGMPFEVATFRKDLGAPGDGRHPAEVAFTGVEEDAHRRDFTINGMFFDPLTDTIIDYVNGRRDLERGIVRAIGDPGRRFSEDYLRLIRAIRFAARFGFEIEPLTWTALRKNAGGIKKISAERIFQEMEKILLGPHPDRALSLLHESSLLSIVFPEIERCVGVAQPEKFHPEGDVFTHTVKALSLLDKPTNTAAWSALLHDIGKPATMTLAEDRIRFSNHDMTGAHMARDLLGRLKAPSQLIESVYSVIANHMNFMNVRKMRLSTLKKFLARPTLEDEMELHRVDCLASHGDVSNYDFIRTKQKDLPAGEIKPAALIGGRDLIMLGMTPGPAFGKILEEAYDLQLEEKLLTRENAVEWVKKKYVDA
jgi:poly(A) polymerase